MIKPILAVALLVIVPATSAVNQSEKEKWLQDLNKAMTGSLDRCLKRPKVKRCEITYQVHAVYDKKRQPATMAYRDIRTPKAHSLPRANPTKPASAGFSLEKE